MMLSFNNPNDPAYTFIQQAVSSLQKRQLENAIAYFNKAIMINPNNLSIYMIASNYLTNKKQYDFAIQFLKQAIEIDFFYSQAYQNISLILTMKGNPQQAIIYLQNAIDFNPNNIMLIKRLGDLLFRVGLFEEAINIYQKTINKSIHSTADVYFKMGCAYRSLHKLQEALKSINKAIHYSYNNIFYIVNRAIVLSMINQQQNCIEDLDRSLEQLSKIPHYPSTSYTDLMSQPPIGIGMINPPMINPPIINPPMIISPMMNQPMMNLPMVNPSMMSIPPFMGLYPIMSSSRKQLQQPIRMFKELIQKVIDIKLKQKDSQLLQKTLQIQKQIQNTFLKSIQLVQNIKTRNDQKIVGQKQIFKSLKTKLDSLKQQMQLK